MAWSRFRYEGEATDGAWAWGDPASPVKLRGRLARAAARGSLEIRRRARRSGLRRGAGERSRSRPGPAAPAPMCGPTKAERVSRLDAAITPRPQAETCRRPDKADAGRLAAQANLGTRAKAAPWFFTTRSCGNTSPLESAAAVDAALARDRGGLRDAAKRRWLGYVHGARLGARGWRQTEVRLTLWPGGEDRLARPIRSPSRRVGRGCQFEAAGRPDTAPQLSGTARR